MNYFANFFYHHIFFFIFYSNYSYLRQFVSRWSLEWCTKMKCASMLQSNANEIGGTLQWNNNAKIKQHFQMTLILTPESNSILRILQRSTIFRRSSDLCNWVYVFCIIECRNVAIFEKKWAFKIIIFIILVGTRGAQLSFFLHLNLFSFFLHPIISITTLLLPRFLAASCHLD